MREIRLSTWIFLAIVSVAYLYVLAGGTLNGKGVGPVSRTAILIVWPVGVVIAVGSTLWSKRRR